MKRVAILAVLAALTCFGFARQASAADGANIQGLHPFSAQAKYMSLTGFLRWQYFKEHNVWISRQEAGESVRVQLRASE